MHVHKPSWRVVDLPAADVYESMRHVMAQPPISDSERKALRDAIAHTKASA